jgi:hypothetical protein
LFQLYAARIMLCPSRYAGDRELDRHRRDRHRRRADLERLATVREDVVERRRAANPGQEVGPDHPLVVLGHRFARRRELLRRRRRGRERVDDAVVEVDEREVRLRDRQVLVVPRVLDHRLARRPAQEV